MDYPEKLLQLAPIFDILSYQCTETASTETLYMLFSNLLIPILIGKLGDEDYCFSQMIHLRYNLENNEVNFSSDNANISMRCSQNGSRFILYLIHLVFVRNNVFSGRHSEALLVDNISKTIEFFEPNGSGASWYPSVSRFLQYKFSTVLPNYRFISTEEFCPRTGPQAISGQGICGSFSLLFLLMRVYNPEISPQRLLNLLTRLSRTQIQHLMRQFICYTEAFSEEHNLQELQGLYGDVSDRVTDNPELSALVDSIYYSQDYIALQQFDRDLDTKDTSLASNTVYFHSEKDAFGEFSNSYSSPFTLNGVLYPTVEHYFQAQKFMGSNATPKSLEYAQLIISQNTPNKAKILGNKQVRSGYGWVEELNNIIRQYEDVNVRLDWEDVKNNIIRKGIFQKFLQNPNLLTLLLSTGEKTLINYTFKDNYWGNGKNQLGKILMETRSLLRYQVIPAGNRNYWVIRNLLLIGYIDVHILNQVGVKYILDLSGRQAVSYKIFGKVLSDPISVYKGEIILVNPTETTPLIQLVDLTIQSLGKDYVSYIFAFREKYVEFLTLLLNKFYELPLELSGQLVGRLLQ